MPKTLISTHYSLRCKFKNEDTVELVVINSDTNEIHELLWTFKDIKHPVKSVTVTKADIEEDEE